MFTITVICTGNRNRSPILEACIRRYGAGFPIDVDSVGLLDLGPLPALPESIAAARLLGLDISGHRARTVTTVDLTDRDLIIGLEWQHVAAAVVEGGVSRSRAFSLLEIVALLEELDALADGSEEGARAIVSKADSLRANRPIAPHLDILDPFGGPEKGFKEMAHLVEEQSRRLIRRLFGSEVVHEP